MLGGAVFDLGTGLGLNAAGAARLRQLSELANVHVPTSCPPTAETGAKEIVRRKMSEWLNFYSGSGGETKIASIPNARFWQLGPRYTATIRNNDTLGTWARLDTAFHEAVHAFVARHLPTIIDIQQFKVGPVPVGASLTYLEEVAAYSIGHVGSGRLHGVPFAPFEAIASLETTAEKLVGAATGAGITYGGLHYYTHSGKPPGKR